MGPTWDLSAPCWPHEVCYQGCHKRHVTQSFLYPFGKNTSCSQDFCFKLNYRCSDLNFIKRAPDESYWRFKIVYEWSNTPTCRRGVAVGDWWSQLDVAKIHRLLPTYTNIQTCYWSLRVNSQSQASIVLLKFGVDIQSHTEFKIRKPKNPIWLPGGHFECENQ